MELYINSGRACQGIERGQQERVSIHRAIALSSEISYCFNKQRRVGGLCHLNHKEGSSTTAIPVIPKKKLNSVSNSTIEHLEKR
jgi:hypothetical protein